MRFFQQIVDSLPAEVLKSVSRNHTPLMLFDILICLFLDLFSSPSHGGPTSILWVLQRKTNLCTARVAGHSFTAPFSSQERFPAASSTLYSVAFGNGRHWQSSSYPFQCLQTCNFFCYIGVLESLLGKAGPPQGPFICGCLPKSAFSWFFLTTVERVCDLFVNSC